MSASDTKTLIYLFSLPKQTDKRPSLRSHVLSLYDPFAKRSLFAAGIRFCCNTYVGCAHQCVYCYTQTYNDDSAIIPHDKRNFTERFEKDIRELDQLELPPTPLHFSNSTDPLQETLERKHQNTLYLLQRLAQGEHHRFQPIRILTRNPSDLLQSEYLKPLLLLGKKLLVQVSIPIFDSKAGQVYEPNVPPAFKRLQAIADLRSYGVPVSLRIDPLYPRDPLPRELFGVTRITDYDLLPTQSESDLRYLVRSAASCGCHSIVYSGLKIPRNLSSGNQRLMKGWTAFYQSFARDFPNLNSRNYLRLPHEYQHGELIRPLVEEAEQCGIQIEHCKQNLIQAR